MNIEQIKALMEKIETQWQNLDKNVFHIHGEALDNAGWSCIENKEERHDGAFYSIEFYGHYFGSLETILACSDMVTDAGRKFFEEEGVKY